MSRILLASPAFPPRIGGVESYAHRVGTGLRDRHDHDLVVLTTSVGIDPAEVRDDLPVIRLPARLKVSATSFDPAWFSQIRGLVRRLNPDLIITNAPTPGLADVCLMVKRDIPAIATFHSGSMKKDRWALDLLIRPYERAVLPRILARADAVVTTYRGGPFGSRFIPPGVDSTVFHPRGTVAKDPNLILYVGRIEHASAWKGIDTLIRAMAVLARQRPSLRLELVGAGDAVEHHSRMARSLGLGERVVFRGPLGGEELALAYRTASIAVLPSVTNAEAFGMVLIEAMACGTPVVASRIGGMPAVLNDTGGGILAEPGDPESLAYAIGSLLDDPERAKALAAQGARRVREFYTWDRVVDEYDDLIGSILAGRQSERSVEGRGTKA
jgi:glycosyltransferase involved in cell wall biosynthesis